MNLQNVSGLCVEDIDHLPRIKARLKARREMVAKIAFIGGKRYNKGALFSVPDSICLS